jgi:hypothetical protein
MTSRGWTTIGALALCALAFCAFGAAGASAIEKGLTAVKCVEVAAGTGNYESSHCETSKPGTDYNTVAIEGSTEIEGTSTNAEGGPEASKLTATLGGLNTIIECAHAHTSGTVTNVVAKDEKGAERHAIHGTNTTATYTGCKAHLASKPSRTCEVEEVSGGGSAKGMITLAPLTATTTGVGHQVKFNPEKEEPFTKFKILTTGESCFFGTAVTVEVTGALEGEANTTVHSHLTFTEANNGSNLKANGATTHYTATSGAWMKRTAEEIEKEAPKVTVGAETFT